MNECVPEDLVTPVKPDADSLVKLEELMTDIARLRHDGSTQYAGGMQKACVGDLPPKPRAAIVGGVDVGTKISEIEFMLENADKLVIGGAVAFTFLKARGFTVGASEVDDSYLELAGAWLGKAKKKGVEVILPRDVVCSAEFPGEGEAVTFKVVAVDAIPACWFGLDVGPETRKEIKSALAECNTIIWKGPLGVVESEQFATGTDDIIHFLMQLKSRREVTVIIDDEFMAL